MKTLKIQVEETTKNKKEVEITLPAYRKDGNSFFRVSEKHNCVEVQIYKNLGDAAIHRRAIDVPFNSGTEESNEQEFNDAFERAITMLKNF